ncbi:MAG: ABC transporter ATP-binding protein [Oscillospiraceae bacterium]|nr:ABC transporter ATP-binding protein [Oscillospiraceae bacterium]
MENKNVCLELKCIGKSFGGLRAVNEINLQVFDGDRLAIIGPNGAGKTTLFNMVSGEFPPTDGQVILYGEDVTKQPNSVRVKKGLARTYQITTLFFDLSVMENVILALIGTTKIKFRMFKSVKKYDYLYDEAEALLDRLHLLEKKDEIVKNLSYGDQRLIELVLALASKPKILCLDEPCAGLSVAESKLMLKTLKELPEDLTLILIEHDMDLVFEAVDRIMVVHNGNHVATGLNAEIRANNRVQQVYLGELEEEEGSSGC